MCRIQIVKPLTHLIKATHPLERLSLDFKDPLPSCTFACPNLETGTVIRGLDQLFAIFGMPNYIHSDHGKSFMARELKDHLHNLGIATCRTTS